ncbi:MAG: hypothetical protein ACK6D7_00235 [Acidobacteriota bacterium]
MPREPKVYRTPTDPGFVGGYNWSAMLTGLALLATVNVAATQFIAHQFRYQPALGQPILVHSDHAIYQPTACAHSSG